jgi:hypothetical protein
VLFRSSSVRTGLDPQGKGPGTVAELVEAGEQVFGKERQRAHGTGVVVHEKRLDAERSELFRQIVEDGRRVGGEDDERVSRFRHHEDPVGFFSQGAEEKGDILRGGSGPGTLEVLQYGRGKKPLRGTSVSSRKDLAVVPFRLTR